MKITSENLPDRQVRLQIEADDQRHAQAMEQAYKRLAPRVQIRGFRPGKAPRPLIEKQLGQHRIQDEAMDILVPQLYTEAIKDQGLDPVAGPSVEVVSHEPLVFTATVPLQPVTDLGDYHSLRVGKENVDVAEEEVEEQIDELRHRYGTVEPVERPVQDGDMVRATLKVDLDESSLFASEDIEFEVTKEYLVSLPGLYDLLLGLSKGDEIEQVVKVPEDAPDARMAGQDVLYKIAVKEVKEQKLPELDDAFAKEVGEGFENIEALRTQIRDNLKQQAESTALRRYENTAIDVLVESAKLEYPPVMIEHEVEHILEDQNNPDPRDPLAQQMYLARLSMSPEEIRESVRPEAESRLRRSLVVSQFAEAETIAVEETDVDAEIDKMVSSVVGEQADQIRRLFDNESGRVALRRSLLTRKTLDRLVEIVGAEPTAPVEPEPAAKPTRQRRTAPRKQAEPPPGNKVEESA